MAKKIIIPVALYLRMSSDQQDTSIARQEKECKKYARKPIHFSHDTELHIVEVYVDEGQSGLKEREDFKRMLADAEHAKWEAVLVFDHKRFARMDSIQRSIYKQTLRSSGKYLITTTDGKIDWSTFADRITDMIRDEMDHEDVATFINNSVTGRELQLSNGFWPCGSLPFGYDREYWFEGVPVSRMDRNAKVKGAKANGWRLKLVINDEEAEIVRWVAEEYVNKDKSKRQLGRELTKRGVPTPRGGKVWTKDTVGDLLRNAAYIGECRVGQGRRRRKERFRRMTPTIKKNACPAILDQPLWESIQRKLEREQKNGRTTRSHRSSPLSGILYCGHCGYSMEKKSRRDAKGRTYVFFTCSSANKRPNLGCGQWRVHEADMMEVVSTKLLEGVNFELLRTLSSGPTPKESSDLDRLQKQAAKLRADIKRGSSRLLRVPDNLAETVERELTEWKSDLDALEDRIANLQVPEMNGVSSYSEWRKEVKDRLITLVGPQWENGGVRKLPILLTGPHRKTIEDELRKTTGKVLVQFGPDLSMTFGCGNVIEIDEEGQAWEYQEVDRLARPSIMTEPDVLREFLHSIGCRVKLYWQRGESRYHILDRGKIAATINENSLAGRSATLAPATNTWV